MVDNFQRHQLMPRKTSLLFLFYFICCCLRRSQAADSTSTVITPADLTSSPDYWLKATHSTTCPKYTVRTFLVENTKEDDTLSLVIRQNIRGRIVVNELAKGPASNHKVQVALNWTAQSEDILSALQNSHEVIGSGSEKVVLMQVYVGDVKSKMDLSPVVIGGTVTGFLVMMGLIITALYFARRKGQGTGTRMTSPNSSSQSSAAEDEEEDVDTDFYHPSTYMADSHGSHGEDDTSLNLSGMPDELRMDDSHDIHTLSSVRAANRMMSSADSKHLQSESSKDEQMELPPPPPPPAEFEASAASYRASVDSNPYEDIASLKRKVIPPTSISMDQTSDSKWPPRGEATPRDSKHSIDPTYAAIDKNRPPPPTTFPPPLAQSSDIESEPSSSSSSQQRRHGGGGGGYIGSSLLGRTVMIVGVLSIIAQCVYTMCHDDLSVEVMIFLPKGTKISSIHLYSNKDKPSVFQPTDWYLANMAKFRTFDIDDVGTLDEYKPCYPQTVCPTAPNQTYLGCDWKTQRCVCKRGWTLNNKQVCVDVDECELGRCPANMQCTNLPGSYSCICNDGHFWNGDRCQTCTVGCSEGFFQISPCNSTADVACQRCSKCLAGTFTYQPCNGIDDTQCMEVAQPYLQYPNATVIESNQVAIKTSPNVFIEELHKTKNEKRTVFVTANSQQNNFQLNRDSGIRIFVHVSNYSIIPEFTDAEHENDNAFVQSVLPQKKSQLNKVIYNYCRSPIPDYYTLTMNKYKGRTTVIQDIVCNSTLMNCPPRFSDGQIYRFRTYNTQCPKTTVELTEVHNEGNSVACNERTPLLSDIFNETMSRDSPRTFPSLSCKQSIYKCKDCISNNKCGELGVNESCCAVSCHAQRECKVATSDECSSAPIECATGDTVQFLVQPVFEDLSKQFLCHLERRKPTSVFRLSYHIVVPTPDGWNSSKRIADLRTGGESQATQVSDYLTIKYNNHLRNSEDGDMLLRGDYNARSREYDFTLLDFKPRSEFNKTKVKPVKYETSRNQATITSSIQNERPFEISTWNFNSKHGCYADTTKIHGKQPMYSSSSAQRVQVYMVKGNTGFTYDISSHNGDPEIDFLVPGNQSVLFYYFPNSTLNYKSVSVKLVDKTEPFYIYSIQVSGHMTSCNSYLGINIYDKTTESTVASYDTLIYCSKASNSMPTFHFDIKMPNKGSKNKLFAVSLRDSHTTVSYYVTTYSYSSSLIQNNTVDLYNISESTNADPTTFFGMLACLALIGLIFGCLYFLISYKIITIAKFPSSTTGCNYASIRRNIIILVYCLFKLIYSLVFSLTVLLLLVKLLCSKDLEQVNEMPAYHIEIKELVQRNIQGITNFKRGEIKRQYEMKNERLDACGDYALQSVQAIKSYVSHYSQEMNDKKDEIENKKFDILMSEIHHHLEATKVYVDKHKRHVDTQIRDILSDYNSLLKEMVDNSWLNLPFLNYKSTADSTEPRYQRGLLSAESVNFLAYLGVDRPAATLRQIELLNQQLDIMYQGMKFDIDRNLGLGILRELDTSGLSTFTIKRYQDKIEVPDPAFAIEKEVKFKSSGPTTLLYIVVIVCDALLFIYRMCSLSHTVYRLKNGFAEEVQESSDDNKLSSSVKRENLQIELRNIKNQIVGEEEMSKSLLDEMEEPDENLNMKSAGNSKQLQKQRSQSQSEGGVSAYYSDIERQPRAKNSGSRSQSVNDSDIEQVRSSKKRSVDESEPELPPIRGSERGLTSRGTSRATSRAGSAMSDKIEKQWPGRHASRAASGAGSVSHVSRGKTPSVVSDKPTSSGLSEHQTTVEDFSGTSEHAPSTHPGGCAAKRLSKILLSKYTTPVILWLGSQVLAIIIISILNELLTYNSMIQLTNIDSMISHIGMYTSVVNSYLITHAQLISQSAQATMVDEFNYHLHHIAKVKSIIETDLNWSLHDYNNKLCVLDNKLVEHCTFHRQQLNVSIMPCQSFPIEAIQFTDKGGLNVDMISTRIQGFTDSIISLITTFITLLTFYIDAVAIIHILSLVINKVLHYKGFIHIIKVQSTRLPVPTIEIKEKQHPPTLSAPSLLVSGESDSQNISDNAASIAIGQSGRSSRQDTLDSEHSNYNTQSGRVTSPRSQGDDEDPLLSTIKAQQGIHRQLTDDNMSETSALLSNKKAGARGGNSTADHSECETGL